MKIIHSFIILFFVIILGGCLNFSGQTSGEHNFNSIPFTQRQKSLAQLSQFELEGNFSIQPSGQLPVIANYDWKQWSRQQYRIDINAPLNLVHADITGTPQSVTINTSQGQSASASSAELLMQQMLGWSLPISDLWYWVRGLPATTIPMNIYYDQYGHLRTLQQEGWTVHFIQYTKISSLMDLPQQIVLTRPGITAKIVIKNWIIK